MTRENIEFMLGWLDALRRDDRDALRASLVPEVVWQGLREEWVCHGPDEVVNTFTARRDESREVDSLELIAGEQHAILHVRGAGPLDLDLPDGIYNVFAISDRRIARIDDYTSRGSAFTAARIEWR